MFHNKSYLEFSLGSPRVDSLHVPHLLFKSLLVAVLARLFGSLGLEVRQLFPMFPLHVQPEVDFLTEAAVTAGLHTAIYGSLFKGLV